MECYYHYQSVFGLLLNLAAVLVKRYMPPPQGHVLLLETLSNKGWKPFFKNLNQRNPNRLIYIDIKSCKHLVLRERQEIRRKSKLKIQFQARNVKFEVERNL